VEQVDVGAEAEVVAGLTRLCEAHRDAKMAKIAAGIGEVLWRTWEARLYAIATNEASLAWLRGQGRIRAKVCGAVGRPVQ